MSDYKENENDLTNDRDLNENNMTIFLSSPEDEEFEPDEEQTSSGSKIRIAILILILVAVAGFATKSLFFSKKLYKSYEVSAQSAKTLPEDAGYATDYDKLLSYNSEGISIYNEKAEIEWNAALNMTNPKITVNSGYAVVADIGGRNILVVNHKSVPAAQVSLTMLNDILLTDISEQGEIAVLMQDEKGYDIQLINPFDKNNSLKAEIKTYSKDDGYALSLAMSKDGSKLVTEYVKTENNEIKSTLTFYNFDKVGENSNADRIVGVFPFEDTIFPKLKFADNNTVCAYGDNKIVCFAAKKEPEILWEKKVAGKIERIAEDKNGFAILVDESGLLQANTGVVASDSAIEDDYIDSAYLTGEADGNGKTVLYSMHYSGGRVYSNEVDINPKGMSYNDGEIVLYSDTNCIIFDSNGNIKFKNKFNDGITSFTQAGGRTRYYAIVGKKLKVMRLSE
jgi:hypothetical protein